MTSFARYQCWDDTQISQVINKEALTVDRATFLATHVPIRHIAYEHAPHHLDSPTDEKALLNELDERTNQNLHTFAVLKGIPGTGKSHLIRWLKEQYEIQHPDDKTVLIERSNSSLRNTLQQVTRLFDVQALPESLQRLNQATQELSKGELAHGIWSQLLGGHERVLSGDLNLTHDRVPVKRIVTGIKRFLLDDTVRDTLLRPGGPLDRIASFLSEGLSTRESIDVVPGFEPNDFELPPKVRLKIHYQEARDLVDDLQHGTNQEDLVRYFNDLLNEYAISRATRLSENDLKQMFSDLRYYLMQQGQGLALFIEDITAFTGIDLGIVDVLVAQHLREGEQQLCRLLSVIGVTDGYFQDRFPDNIKDRITHLLTLNAIDGDESDLLRDTDIQAEFAARYLNAMRVPLNDMQVWADHRARTTEMPNACASCLHRDVCHASFGYVELQSNSTEDDRVGLYPFNRQALGTMYEYIDTSKNKRTPRTFLNGIISYVMQSHAHKIREGRFPPPAVTLGSDFRVPLFDSPLDQQVITANYPAQSDRLQTLFLYWGIKRVVRTEENNNTLIGGMSEHVFEAFDLPVVDAYTETSPSKPSAKLAQSVKVPPRASPLRAEEQPYTQHLKLVDDWVRGGQLFRYEDFSRWLAEFVDGAIDWELHNIHPTQADELVKAGFFVFEDQSAPSRRTAQLSFERNGKNIGVVLQALAVLNLGKFENLAEDELSGYFALLGSWLYREEERIVQFVRQPKGANDSEHTVQEMLLSDGLFLLGLEDGFDGASDELDLYKRLVNSAKESTHQLSMMHSPAWLKLAENLQKDATNVRKELLLALSCSSRDGHVLDFPLALQVIQHLNNAQWQMSPLLCDYPSSTVGEKACTTYNHLASTLRDVLEHEKTFVIEIRDTLRSYLGDASIMPLVKRTARLLKQLRDAQHAYNGEVLDIYFKDNPVRPLLTVDELAKLQQVADALETAQTQGDLLFLLGGPAARLTPDLRQAVYVFQILEQELDQVLNRLSRSSDVDTTSDLGQLAQTVEQAYQETSDLFSQIGS